MALLAHLLVATCCASAPLPSSPQVVDAPAVAVLPAPGDTIALPDGWPEAFPTIPAGGSVAGVTEVDPDRLRGDRVGPYHIVALNLPGTEAEGFDHYLEGLEVAGWEIDDALTNDGSRPGLVTIGFRGHGFEGDIRFQEVLGAVLATVHLYRGSPGLP